MKKILTIGAGVVGVLFIILAFVYWFTPANSLPSFVPGHSSLHVIHYKHAIASFIVGLLAFVYVWFNSKKKTISVR